MSAAQPLNDIKARAEELGQVNTADLASKLISYGEEYMLLAKVEADHRRLIAALEAALVTADALIEENQDATTLQSWGLMTAAQKVHTAITEALQ